MNQISVPCTWKWWEIFRAKGRRASKSEEKECLPLSKFDALSIKDTVLCYVNLTKCKRGKIGWSLDRFMCHRYSHEFFSPQIPCKSNKSPFDGLSVSDIVLSRKNSASWMNERDKKSYHYRVLKLRSYRGGSSYLIPYILLVLMQQMGIMSPGNFFVTNPKLNVNFICHAELNTALCIICVPNFPGFMVRIWFLGPKNSSC